MVFQKQEENGFVCLDDITNKGQVDFVEDTDLHTAQIMQQKLDEKYRTSESKTLIEYKCCLMNVLIFSQLEKCRCST